MCLIIDVNVVHKFFPEPSEDFKPIHKAIDEGRAKLVYGGELTREYRKTAAFRRFLFRLDQQGKARQVADSKVDAETKRLSEGSFCVSDDPHIIALARVGAVRLLCSEDEALATDFTNQALLGKPRGSVYKRAEHAHLLHKHCSNLAASR
jgi:hypothetical protein